MALSLSIRLWVVANNQGCYLRHLGIYIALHTSQVPLRLVVHDEGILCKIPNQRAQAPSQPGLLEFQRRSGD